MSGDLFAKEFKKNQKIVNQALAEILDKQKIIPSFKKVLHYALLAPGKRVRPNLVFFTHLLVSELMNKKITLTREIINLAAAIECIHTYSLIHDDLPAMDDDSMRRGRETVHIKFDEATAILAGDALLNLAFEILCQLRTPHLSKDLSKVISTVAQASGALGMVAGQYLDLRSEGKNISLAELTNLHSFKTGQMIVASVLSVVYLHGLEKHKPLYKKHFLAYAEAIGLCFQVVDDIIDVTQTSEDLGKDAGSDLKKNKSTFVRLLGLEKAREKAQALNAQAKISLGKIAQTYSKSNGQNIASQKKTKEVRISYLADLADLILNRLK